MRLLTMSSPTNAMPLRVPGDPTANLLCNVRGCQKIQKNSLHLADQHCCSVVLSIQICFVKQVCMFGLFVWVVKRCHLGQCHYG